MLKFILGGAGCGKSTLLTERINEIADGDKKVIVIVPEQFSFDSDKKLYEKLGCMRFNRILSMSFTSITKEIFEKYGSRSGEYAEDMDKLIIMKKTLDKLDLEKQLRFFSRQVQRPDFVSEALGVITEFRQSGVSADDFASKMSSADVTFSDKISDLSLIYYTYDALLRESGLKDNLADISEAAAIAEMNSFFENTAVFFDEFESFTSDEYQLIEAIIAQADEVTLSLRLDSPEHSGNNIFESAKNTWRKFYSCAKKYGCEIESVTLDKPLKYKNADLAHLNLNILRPVRQRFGETESIRVAECTDMYEEADWICSEIRRMVQEKGYRYKDIAVMSRNLSQYVHIFEAAFEKYEIPFHMDVKKSVMHTSVMQYVSAVVEIIAEKKFSSDMIFKYAKTHLCGVSFERISELENYCFEWNIDGKLWEQPFESGLDEHPFAEQTRKEIIAPLTALRKKCRNKSGREICIALYKFLSDMEIPKKVGGIINEFLQNKEEFLAKEFRRIWDIFTNILDTLADSAGEISLPVFRDLFLMMLRQITYSVPPQTLDGVKISPAETARPDNPKIVFVAGVNEGKFPPDIHQAGILTQKDRELFEASGISISRKNEELISDESLIVYKTLTHACDRLYITYPLSDTSGANLFPSSFLKQLYQMFENLTPEIAKRRSLIDYCPTPKAAYSNLVRYFGESTPETESLRQVLSEIPEYKAKLDYLEEACADKSFSVSDSSIMRELFTDRLYLSATQLDEYNSCHFKYFCNKGLRLRARKKRAVDKLGRGNLTHMCLEKILSSCETKEDFEQLDTVRIREIIEECSKEFLSETLGAENSKTPSVIAAVESVCDNITDVVRHLQKELAQSLFRPAAFELDISEGNDKPVLRADNGVEIYLKGVVDRVDVYEEDGKKYLRVIDYKTGSKKINLASLYYGLDLQMLLYLFSLTDKNNRFSEHEPAGVLYMSASGAGCKDRESKVSYDDFMDAHYKMNGLLLKDRLVLEAMEKDIRGVYIPAKVTSKDKGDGKLLLDKRASLCMTKKNFEKLSGHIDDVMLKMCDELYSGKIEAEPYISATTNPCGFCDYGGICGNADAETRRTAEADAKDKMMELLGGDDDYEQMDT
ncbi:MAG: PD-(D/E)XK nuclease family protein [Oscillospiraceae bacterium]|nr:PD-(D/E)XK nuclease family protein [Oscillospiraceae bacterium]